MKFLLFTYLVGKHDHRVNYGHLEDLVHKGPRMLDRVPKCPVFYVNFVMATDVYGEWVCQLRNLISRGKKITKKKSILRRREFCTVCEYLEKQNNVRTFFFLQNKI